MVHQLTRVADTIILLPRRQAATATHGRPRGPLLPRMYRHAVLEVSRSLRAKKALIGVLQPPACITNAIGQGRGKEAPTDSGERWRQRRKRTWGEFAAVYTSCDTCWKRCVVLGRCLAHVRAAGEAGSEWRAWLWPSGLRGAPVS
jgi:hypothetical protein